MKIWKASLLSILIPHACISKLVTFDVDVDADELDGASMLQCTTLRFTQESAPQKLSDVHRSLTEALNRERTGSELKLEVEWTGDFKDRRPGEYLIMAKVGGLPRCYRYIIQDVDECAAGKATSSTDLSSFSGGAIPQGKEWIHQCDSSAECLNKNGTYECQCPFIESVGRRSTPMPSKWPCQGKTSTEECCDGHRDTLTHSQCKRDFACYSSACDKAHTCERANGQCMDSFNASGYSCACKPGFVGNGHTCSSSPAHKKGFTVFEDDETGELTYVSVADQTIETDPARVCGCHQPIKKGHCRSSDCCGGEVPCNEECATDGHGCKCKDDFENTTIRSDPKSGLALEWACVDPTPPKVRLLAQDGSFVPLSLRKHVVKITQFEAYEDFGYDIDDDNKDADMRKFEMRGEVPRGRLMHLGTHNVVFKTWTGPDAKPWSSHSVTREIQVINANECLLSADTLAACPACGPHCAPEASCADEDGSYSCVCPACGQRGDGFQRMPFNDPQMPPTYVNGSGCTDSCAPVIELQGDPVKLFTVCKCEGPLCPSGEDAVNWDARVRAMLVEKPDELCPDGMTFPCAVALDPTMDGTSYRDVTSQIVVGEPVRLEGLAWQIPLNVEDESGNKAATVFREIHVKELTVQEIEEQAMNKFKQHDKSAASRSAPPPPPKQSCNCPKEVARKPLSPPPPLPVSTAASKCPKCVCPNVTAAAASPPPPMPQPEKPCPSPSILSSSNEPLAWIVLGFLLVFLLFLVRCCIFLIPDDTSPQVPRSRGSSSVHVSGPSTNSRTPQQQMRSPPGTSPAGFQYSPYPRQSSPEAWKPRTPR